MANLNAFLIVESIFFYLSRQIKLRFHEAGDRKYNSQDIGNTQHASLGEKIFKTVIYC